tara:strand:- start:169 stop:1470 length:1302 start_codon:yes stop_codon:yes gene_type:complete
MYSCRSILTAIATLFESNDTLTGKAIADNIPAFQPIDDRRIASDIISAKTKQDIETIVIALINTSFAPKESFDNKTIVCKKDLHKRKPLKGVDFVNILRFLATHPVKNMESGNFEGNIFCMQNMVDVPEGKSYGITAIDTPEQKEVLFTGNAALIATSRLLTVGIEYNGTIYYLPHLLTTFPSLCNLFINAGMEKDDFHQTLNICQGMLTGQFPKSAQGKQVFWAIDDTPDELEYILITPVPSSRVMRNIRKLFRSLNHKESNSFLPAEFKSLGGTKPQNVSDLNQKFGGMNYLFAGKLDFIGKHMDELNVRLRTGKPLVKPIFIRNGDILLSQVLLTNSKSAYSLSLKTAIGDSLSVFYEYMDMALNCDKKPANDTERQFSNNPKDGDSIKLFSEYLYKNLMECWKHHHCNPDPSVKAFARKEIERFVRQGI